MHCLIKCSLKPERFWFKTLALFHPPVRLLLRHGADPTKKNRDGHTPVDLVKEGDQDVLDLLRGDSALLDAAKKGNLGRVQKLATPENVNCRDSQVRIYLVTPCTGWSICSDSWVGLIDFDFCCSTL